MVAIAEESRKGPMDINECYNWVTFDGKQTEPLHVLLR